MKKYEYILLIGLFTIISLGIGVISFIHAGNISDDFGVFKKMEWAIPLTSDYDFIVWDHHKGFEGCKAGDSKSLEYNGKIVFDEEEKTEDSTYNIIDGDTYSSVVDKKGKTLYKTDSNASINNITGNYFEVDGGNYLRVIDISDGHTVMELKDYSSISPIGGNCYSALLHESVDNESIYIILDKNFKPTFGGKLFTKVNDFGEGLAYAKQLKKGTLYDLPKQVETESGFINVRGQMEVPLGEDSVEVNGFSEGKAIIYTKNLMKCINKNGHTIYEKKLRRKVTDIANWGKLFSKYINGLAIGYDGKAQGILDNKGGWVIKPVFDTIMLEGKNAAIVQYKDQHGVIVLGGGGEDVK